MQQIENEAKLYVLDLAPIEARLKELGAEMVAPRVYERNVRFEDLASTFTGRGIVLRLRYDTRARLTFKEPLTEVDEDISARFEAEVEVSDFDAMQAILERLGFHPSVIYEKYRTSYHLDDAEIVLDEMPYGKFIEIEGETEVIHRVIEALNLQTAPRFSTNYLGLFDRVKHHLGLTFHHLTFENFAGRDVPPSAFQPVE